ncbi:MAG: hypothetical protein ACJ77B_00015 [Chloroflexota bacterium]
MHSTVTANSTSRRGLLRHRLAGFGMVTMFAAVVAIGLSAGAARVDALAGCRIYVASGDEIANGKDLNDNSKRYPEQLVANHIKSPGWCLFNQAKNGQSSSSYISGGGLANAYNMRPDFLTLQLAEQNATIVNLVTDCFDKIKDHDFSGGTTCASTILGNSSLWTNLKNNYTTILQQTRVMMSQRPQLVVAVVNYPNPYPHADTAAEKIAQLCTPLIDTIATCTIRWVQLPPALLVLDQVFTKMNNTLKESLAPFNQGPSGSRWVYVDAAPKLKDHCMKMEVTIKTKVEHPEEDGVVHDHDDFTATNFGCDTPWFTAGSDGTKIPDYLDPAVPGVLIDKSQTTSGMGVYPNADGQKCIADAIWEADTIDPGTTPLKWKLGYGEASNTDICQ